MQGLEVTSNCVEDMDEWLGMFNIKLRHMREDIESVSSLFNVGILEVVVIYVFIYKI